MNIDEIRTKDGTLPHTAWPGGYPMYYVDDKNCVLCPDCANKDGYGFEIVAYDINWEDENLYCDDCNEKIESAYGGDGDE